MSGKHDIADVVSADDRQRRRGSRDDGLRLLRWSLCDAGRCARGRRGGERRGRRPGRDAERRDEHVHQHHEVQQVGGALWASDFRRAVT